MKKINVVLGLLFIAVVVTPAMAVTVTYPEGYYELIQKADQAISDGSGDMGQVDWKQRDVELGIFYELRRQSILLEKQNELLAQLLEKQSGGGFEPLPIITNETPIFCNITFQSSAACWGDNNSYSIYNTEANWKPITTI